MRALILILLIVASLAAHARPPEPGVWWNPSESGRGWILEGQNDIWSISHFSYSQAGDSLFYVTVGIWNEDTDTIQGSLLAPTDGQCVGCPYRAPTQPNLGVMRFVFDTPWRGRAIYPNGTTIPIEKFTYGFASRNHQLLGTWSTVWHPPVGGVGIAHNIYFRQIETLSSGPAATGVKVDFAPGRPAIAAAVPNQPIYFALVDSSTEFWTYLFFIIEGDIVYGTACNGLKIDPPPPAEQCNGLVSGHRKLTLAGSQREYPLVAKSLDSDGVDHRADQIARVVSDAGVHHIDPQVERFHQKFAPYSDEFREISLDLWRTMLERESE